MEVKKWPTFKILNVKVDFPTQKQALKWVEQVVNYNKVCQITTPNPEQVVLAQKDLEFHRVLNNADLSICDGVGLFWAVKLGFARGRFLLSRSPEAILKPPFGMSETGLTARTVVSAERRRLLRGEINRLSGTDLMLDLCQLAGCKGWRVMLLGGRNGVAALAAEKIKNLKFKNKNYNEKFKIIGLNGSKNIKTETEKERQEIIKKINKFQPQLLFVAYGAPQQEKWIAENLPALKTNIAMGVGGAFDYISGRVRRAPGFVRKIGLEWFWRLFLQPWRLKRQLALLKFIRLVIFNKKND
jgi:N-acetylglucosaminyldiphosphoundecaprenol N-acetyl-beta-D-mannosaminyltransferase